MLFRSWNAIAGTFANENWGFQILELVPTSTNSGCDSDGDKITDDYDFDSDNDGCPDVREAGHQEPYISSPFGDPVIAGDYGQNGLSSLVENNDTDAATIDYTVAKTQNDIKDYVNPNYRLVFKYAFAPDELFFQTLYMNLAKTNNWELVNAATHFVRFNGVAANPDYLSQYDLDAIPEKDQYLFARKYRYESA